MKNEKQYCSLRQAVEYLSYGLEPSNNKAIISERNRDIDHNSKEMINSEKIIKKWLLNGDLTAIGLHGHMIITDAGNDDENSLIKLRFSNKNNWQKLFDNTLNVQDNNYSPDKELNDIFLQQRENAEENIFLCLPYRDCLNTAINGIKTLVAYKRDLPYTKELINLKQFNDVAIDSRTSLITEAFDFIEDIGSNYPTGETVGYCEVEINFEELKSLQKNSIQHMSSDERKKLIIRTAKKLPADIISVPDAWRAILYALKQNETTPGFHRNTICGILRKIEITDSNGNKIKRFVNAKQGNFRS